MAEFAKRSHAAPPVAHAPGAAATGPLNNAPRVQRLVEHATALNARQAPIQMNGKDGDKKKKPNNTKQEKIKVREAKKKKNDQRKEDELVRSYSSYTTDTRGKKQIRAAVRDLKDEGADLRKGHRSKNSSFNMNSATKGSVDKITGKLRETEIENKKKAKESKRAESDVEDDEEVGDLDVDYGETGYKPRYRKDDDEPPPSGTQIPAF